MGEGARLYGGRWNGIGTAVVYASETRSLAVLETVVHLEQAEFLDRFRIAELSFDSSLVIELPRAALPRRWRADPPGRSVQSVGDAWVRNGESAVLKVPSVLVDDEHNFLINPAHADFAGVAIGRPRRCVIDPRLR